MIKFSEKLTSVQKPVKKAGQSEEKAGQQQILDQKSGLSL